ncbi:hypothetical protein GHN92_05305 [Pseudomonas sp. FSL R10-2964]|uniref:hypothetical protein n=1 Tax=Pseudomonas sp. FSL R10-2964 TaxID=2662202 RepID=UPI00129751C0|nr:hypothetical protein [Pseudomonas sp. FSL R10-2964]MQT83985.1 hypothetical protein [Pseudomonas sp. FSL R10-2964]
MGLREEIQADLAEAFDTDLADAVRAVSGARVVAGEYDPITGSDTGGSTLNYSGRGVFSSYLAREIDGSLIQTTDEKLLVLQNELFVLLDGAQTAEIAAPAIGDINSGKRVLNVSEDPAMATFTIQLRV